MAIWIMMNQGSTMSTLISGPGHQARLFIQSWSRRSQSHSTSSAMPATSEITGPLIRKPAPWITQKAMANFLSLSLRR